jgi:hypothetical protein
MTGGFLRISKNVANVTRAHKTLGHFDLSLFCRHCLRPLPCCYTRASDIGDTGTGATALLCVPPARE